MHSTVIRVAFVLTVYPVVLGVLTVVAKIGAQ